MDYPPVGFVSKCRRPYFFRNLPSQVSRALSTSPFLACRGLYKSSPSRTTAFLACSLKCGKYFPIPPSWVQKAEILLPAKSACLKKLITGVATVYHHTGPPTNIRSYDDILGGFFFNAGKSFVCSSLLASSVSAEYSEG